MGVNLIGIFTFPSDACPPLDSPKKKICSLFKRSLMHISHPLILPSLSLNMLLFCFPSTCIHSRG